MIFKVSAKTLEYLLEIAQSLIYKHENETIGILLVSLSMTRIVAKCYISHIGYKNFDLQT